MIGRRLAHYEVLDKIGAGGMGEVYRARDTRLERDVALKILPPGLAEDPERRDRFEREARAVAALRHPGIVTIHAVEEVEGVRFMAMELVEGRTLTKLIPAGGLPLDRFFDLAIPLADAVAAAHGKGITHRDLKPDNVMVEPDGRLKVLDFGLAKLLEIGLTSDETVAAGPHVTRDGRIVGTVAYMSPEQAEGKPVDPRSDVFSLGIVLYEMITGERPFRGDTQISTITSILRDTPAPVHERKGSVPRQLDRILQRCLEKSPDRRYETARGLRNELESLRVEITRPGATVAAPSARAGIPRPAVVGALALGAALVLGGVWWAARGRGGDASSRGGGEPAPAMIVVFPFENLGPAADEYFAEGISEEITSRLSALQGLGVVSRTSAVQYDRTGKTMQRIAADLGVDYVLEGTVRWARRGDGTSQVRITPQLIRAREDRQVWSTSYDRSMDEIFLVQSEIAGEVVDRLGTAVGGRERDALTEAPTTSIEAYHAYLRAREIIGSITFAREAWDRGVAMLEEACARDPRFLRAYAELGTAHAGYLHFAWDATAERLARSRRAVDRALAIDAGSPWTQLSLGYHHYWGRKDYDHAYEAFSRARAGLPSSSEAIMGMALVRRRQGRFEETVSLVQQAAQLDPRNALIFYTLGETLGILRRYDAARQAADRAIALAPDEASGYILHAQQALLAGDLPAARAMLARSRDGKRVGSETRSLRFWIAIGCRDYDDALAEAATIPDASNAQFTFESRSVARGWALSLSGDAAAARVEFERARPLLEAYAREHPHEPNAHSMLGAVLAHLGRTDEALREARRALELRPATHDQWFRQFRIFDLAVVEILTGRHDDAVARLERLLSRPTEQVSVALLRQSPLFDPLRGHPGFARLLSGSDRSVP